MLYGVLVLLAVTAIYFLFIFPTQWLLVERIHYPLDLNRRIVQISDLHTDKLRISAAALKKRVLKERPDYIFLTGDYTRSGRHIRKVEQYVRQLVEVGVPVYAVLGNHDYKNRSLPYLISVLKRQGVILLRNESADTGAFQLVGIDDYCSGHANSKKSFRKINKLKPVIVITHDPDMVTQLRRSYHLLLAGHLHGKQFNVPFFFKIKNKGELASRGIYKGLHRNDYGAFYISKGIGQAGLNARFLVRSEITVLDL